MRKLVISNSMLKTLSCSTRAWLRTNRYSIQGEEEKALRAGKDAHRALELYGRGAVPDVAVQAFSDSYRPYSDRLLLSTDRYHESNLARFLHVYMTANPLPALPYEIVETESTYELDLGTFDGIQYVVSDKADGLVRLKDSGELFSLEYKTTGSWPSEDYEKDFQLDSQITTHVAAARAVGRDVKGVVLNTLFWAKLPDPNQVTAKGAPARCRAEGHEFVRDCWPAHVKYQRLVLTRTEEDIETWKWNVLQKLHRYRWVLDSDLELLAQEGLFGGCGRCEFLAFCKSHRRNLDGLTQRPREEGILSSGFYTI